ncbi:MAG: hypothetical protein KGD67_05135 [Candidatus Lokiarchaeota archaeon]|nr:hypothetical protein [Candidatus Lokiarchaeota archaeon]
MEKIGIKLEDSLNRVNFIFKNEEITTECINDYNRFSMLGSNFGPFEKGEKYNLPFFVALSLIENNIIKIAVNEKCDNVDVQRFAISERDNQMLLQRETFYFLNKIKEFKFFIEKEVEEKNKPKIDMDRFTSYSTNIVDSRLLKLLKLARSNLTLEDERRLTSSEIILFNKIRELIKIWRTFFLNNK